MPTREGRDSLGHRITVDIPDRDEHPHDTTLDVGALLAAGVATATPATIELDDEPIGLASVVPAGYQLAVETRALREAAEHAEQIAAAPKRTTGHVHVRDLASWTTYVLRHGAPTTEVYADQRRPAVTALLNAPSQNATGWGDHRVTLDLEFSQDWKAWTQANGDGGKYHSQLEFAELIERLQPTIVDPAAATMLELAQTFEMKKDVSFKSSDLLSNGQRQLTYLESVEEKAGERGQITIPKQLVLRVSPWRGVPVAVQLTARFRYRMDGGKLRLGLILDRVDEVLDEAWAAFTDDINGSLNGSESEGGAQRGYPVLQGPAPTYSGRTA
jgi:uncharacterized protein YfdQ (DUF2303 family)